MQANLSRSVSILASNLMFENIQVVILQPPPMAPLPAFAGDNVKVPMTYGEANYFCRRKITMVNGMHTTLAFLTLCRSAVLLLLLQ